MEYAGKLGFSKDGREGEVRWLNWRRRGRGGPCRRCARCARAPSRRRAWSWGRSRRRRGGPCRGPRRRSPVSHSSSADASGASGTRRGSTTPPPPSSCTPPPSPSIAPALRGNGSAATLFPHGDCGGCGFCKGGRINFRRGAEFRIEVTRGVVVVLFANSSEFAYGCFFPTVLQVSNGASKKTSWGRRCDSSV